MNKNRTIEDVLKLENIREKDNPFYKDNYIGRRFFTTIIRAKIGNNDIRKTEIKSFSYMCPLRGNYEKWVTIRWN